MTAELNIVKVTPNVIADVTGVGGGNCGAIKMKNYAIVIDTTMNANLGTQLKDCVVKEFNLPVKYVIFTHYHMDHILGIKSMKDALIISSIDVYNNMKASEIQIADRVKLLKKENPDQEDIEVIFPSLCFTNKIKIYDEDLSIELIHTKGHTSGSSIVLFPKDRVLFAGDLIFEEMFPYAGDPTANPDDLIDAFKLMIDLNYDIIIPGHGPIIRDTGILENHREFFEGMRNNIIQGIREGKSTEEIEIPEFYEQRADELKPMSMEHWYKFYTNKLK